MLLPSVNQKVLSGEENMNLHALRDAAQKAGTQDQKIEQEIVRPFVLQLMARPAGGTAKIDGRYLSEVGRV